MPHDVNSCFYCEHGEPHPVPWRADRDCAVGAFPPDPGTCMCDFEGHTVTGCTHDA